MADNRDDQKSGSQRSESALKVRETERQGQDPNSENDDDMNTAGGRQGNYSDSNRDSEDQWSPGSTQPSDQ